MYDFDLVFKLIQQRHNISYRHFQQANYLKARAHHFENVHLRTSSTHSFIIDLLKSNRLKLTCVLIFSLISILISVSTPFFNNFIVQKFASNTSISYNYLILFALVFSFKLVKNGIAILVDLVQMTLGFEYFAITSYQLLRIKSKINGVFLNLIETDCEKITNLCFCLVTVLINPIQICILMGFIIYYLIDSNHLILFFTLLVTLMLLYLIANYLTFKINKSYLLEKDKRLELNIQNQNYESLRLQRFNQLHRNTQFLYLQIFVKFITYSFSTFLLVYTFIITDRAKILQNQIILLILAGLIRGPVDRLFFAFNLLIQIFYSINRITQFINNHSQSQNRSYGESLPTNLKFQKKLRYKHLQNGQIRFEKIFTYMKQQISLPYFLVLFLFFLFTFAGKYLNFNINRSIIANSYSILEIAGLIYQILIPLGTFFILISLSTKLSTGIFTILKVIRKTSNQFLNRIAGDISAIDKSICLNGYDLMSIVFSIIASFIYSIVSLHNWIFQCILSLSLIFLIFIAFKFYRFIMKSRREVARKELFIKSKLISSVDGDKTIESNRSMKRSWVRIFEAKQIGLLIEVWYNFVLYLLLMIFSTGLIGLSIYLRLQQFNLSIVILACMQIDGDISTMFISAIRVEKAFVSFERVLNAVKQK